MSAFGLSDFLQEWETRADVLGDFVPCGKRIKGAFFRLTREEIKGDFLPALELLAAAVEEVGFTGLFALNAV